MITVENLSKIYQSKNQTVRVLEGVQLEVAEGEFVILTGRSGGGKTTLLSLMGGLTKPTTGKIHMDGVDIWGLSEAKLALVRNQKFGFVFQFGSLIPSLKVLDNVLLPISFSGRRPTLTDQELAYKLLGTVGIPEKAQAFPGQLSGGQQRRVAIARALINNPQVLFADEPTGDLDEETERSIMELFQSIHQQGTTIIMVTHALDFAHIGTRVLTMKDGALSQYTGGGRSA